MPRGNTSVDLNNYVTTGLYLVYNAGEAHKPSFTSGLLFVYKYSSTHIMQIFWSNNDNVAFRHKWASTTTWTDWVEITSIPSFYKNYQTLQSFAAACGIDQTSIKLTILGGEEEENPINTYFYLLEIKLNTSSQTKRGLKFGLSVFSEPQLLYIKNTDTNVWKTIALSPLT